MNGASASTVEATRSSSPVMHRKMARGMSQRLSESLCHNPRANCPMDPNVLANTINPRRVLPRLLITSRNLLLECVHWCFWHCRCALHYAGLSSDQNIDPAAQEC